MPHVPATRGLGETFPEDLVASEEVAVDSEALVVEVSEVEVLVEAGKLVA